MNVEAYRERLDKVIDTRNLTDQEVVRIQKKDKQKHQDKVEKQFKKVIRTGKYLHFKGKCRSKK